MQLALLIHCYNKCNNKIFHFIRSAWKTHFSPNEFITNINNLSYSISVTIALKMYFCNYKFSENYTCLSSKIRTEFTSPTAENPRPRLKSDTAFFSCCNLLLTLLNNLTGSYPISSAHDLVDALSIPPVAFSFSLLVTALSPASPTASGSSVSGDTSSSASASPNNWLCKYHNYY